MKLHWIAPILLLAALLLPAQRHKLVINAETPEGQLLQQIGQEADEAKKLSLMEEFAGKYPGHDGAGWVYDQMVGAYLKAGQFDKALEYGGKLLALDPDDVTTAHNCLKAAEGKKDAALIQKWASATSQAARKAAAAPKPEDEDELENWKNAVDYARQVDIYTEYALYAAVLSQPDAAARIALYEALEAQNPGSQYLPQAVGFYFLSLRQAGQNEKALAVAEKTLATDQTNEEMLLAVADHKLNAKKDPEKVIEYSEKLAALMETKPKPEGMSDEDWSRRKTLLGGLGYWMAGITYGNLKKYGESDAALRKALPMVEANAQLKAQALFYLGLANYELGRARNDRKRLQDAYNFNKQCGAIKSGFAAQALKNNTAITQQYGIR